MTQHTANSSKSYPAIAAVGGNSVLRREGLLRVSDMEVGREC